MFILIIIYLILFLILSWRRLDWSIMLILATLPSYLIRFNISGIPLTLLEAMILISFVAWFAKNYKEVINNIRVRFKSFFKSQVTSHKSNVTRYPFDIEIVLLLIISFIAVAIAGFSNSAFGIWKAYFFEPILFYLLLFNVIKSDTNDPNGIRMIRIDKVIWPLAVSALSVSLVAIYQKITGQLIFNPMWAAEGTRRVVSFFGYPNAVGLYLAPIVMLMLGFFFSVILRPVALAEGYLVEKINIKKQRFFAVAQNDKIKAFFVFFIIILFSLSIYFARSKGAMLGLVAGLVVFSLLASKKLRWASVTLIVIFSLSIYFYAPLKVKAINVLMLKNLSGEIRKQQWQETREMLFANKSNLILGVGLSNYQKAVEPYHQEGIFFNKDNDPDFRRKIVLFSNEYKVKYWQPVEIYMYPHNIFLNFWSELGMVGLLLFIWIFGKFFYFGFKNLKLIGNFLPSEASAQVGKLEIGNWDKASLKYLNIGLICSMVVILIHGLVDVPYFKNDLAVMFWVIVVMMGMLNLELKNKKEN